MDKYEEDVILGQAVYTPFFLNIYDIFVIRFSNKYFWRCHPYKTIELYNRNMSDNHLEIGVGTGYYLKAGNRKNNTHFGLLDLNKNSLNKTEKELSNLGIDTIEAYCHNALEKFPFTNAKYDSVAINYLLHCIPGSIKEKLDSIFNNIISSLEAGRKVTIFGSTIICDEDKHTKLSNAVMSFYQRKGIFHNQLDTYADLQSSLNSYSKDFSVELTGCVALFEVKIST